VPIPVPPNVTSLPGTPDDAIPIAPTKMSVPQPAMPLARDIAIQDVAFFQGVKIPVVAGGQRVATAQRNAPIVAGRDALVRVYVAPSAAWMAHEVTAELVVSGAVGTTAALPVAHDTKVVRGASADENVDSTFNLAIPAASLPAGARFSVAIRDASITPQNVSGSGPNGASYPPGGDLDAVDAVSTGAGVKVVLVPIRYNADGSRRLPDTSDAQLAAYKMEMLSHYPTADVQIMVRSEPMDTNVAIDAQGGGWDELLNELVALRANDGVASDVYYYGAFEPQASVDDYCAAGCVLGLSGLASDAGDPTVRASIGTGYTAGESPGTMSHEIGHAHGRPHAPCGGAADPDPGFPYRGGGVGSWGYDIITHSLIPPTGVTDWMGYCKTTWISDYNYRLIAERMQAVNGAVGTAEAPNAPRLAGGPAAGAGATYRFLNVDRDGGLRWGKSAKLREHPRSSPHVVHFHDETGVRLATATAHYYAYSDLPGGFFLVPEGPAGYHHMTMQTAPEVVRTKSVAAAR
jgi:hypothetical protein